MVFCANMLLDWVTADGSQKVERVLGISQGSDRVVLIDIFDKDSMHYEMSAQDLLAAADQGDLRVLSGDPYACGLLETEIPEKHRRRRDRAWALISPIIELPNGGMFDESIRYRMISKICSEQGVPEVSVYRCMKKFWKRGQTKNALLPDYKNCGGRGKIRIPGDTKRGRPHKLSEVDGIQRGINIGENERKWIQQGMKLFHEDPKAPNPTTLRRAYRQMLGKYFRSNLIPKGGGVLTPVFADAHEIPSLGQALYWYHKLSNPSDVIIAREGVRRFNLRYRAIGGDAAAGASGPGSVYQIDSTPGDVTLVSSLDPNRRIGRATLYFIIDVFSRLIAGFAVTLEEPSYVAAMLSLENALTGKVEFCARHQIAISPEEWPSHHIPEALVADRGEMISKNANHLSDTLGIRTTNTPPYRADLKPFVERSFHSVQSEVIHHLPGAVNQRRERGDKDERLDAVLTLEDFRKIIIHFILAFNRSRIEGFRPQEFMLSDKVEPRPVDLWSWGITNRAGHLRTLGSDLVRLNLLPRSQLTVTERGLRFRNLFYTCDTAQKEDWQVKVRASRSRKREIAYDPLNTDLVYLVTPNGFEACRLMEASATFAHRSWQEVTDFLTGMAELKDRSLTREVQSKTDRDSQIEAVVQNALLRQEGLEEPASKAAALRNIRENRKDERERERAAATAERIPAFETQATASAADIAALHTNGNDNYVPRPENLAELRAQREQHHRKS
jgi:hypothetical protein